MGRFYPIRRNPVAAAGTERTWRRNQPVSTRHQLSQLTRFRHLRRASGDANTHGEENNGSRLSWEKKTIWNKFPAGRWIYNKYTFAGQREFPCPTLYVAARVFPNRSQRTFSITRDSTEAGRTVPLWYVNRRNVGRMEVRLNLPEEEYCTIFPPDRSVNPITITRTASSSRFGPIDSRYRCAGIYITLVFCVWTITQALRKGRPEYRCYYESTYERK